MIKKHLWNIALKLKGRSFKGEYLEIKSISNYDNLLKFQRKYLENLLFHSNENVPYYNKIFNKIKIINQGQIDLSKFNQIPILTKEIMRKNYRELFSKDLATRKWYHNSSGGSTGEPVNLIQDYLYDKWTSATNRYFYQNLIGIDEMNARKIILWGSERDIFEGNIGSKARIINYLTNTLFLNSFRMTEKDEDIYIDSINSYKPDLVRGYAGSLYELCRHAEKKGMKIYTPKVIVSAAETLRDEMREKIESIFRTKLYDIYGSREVGNIAGECKEGLYHIFSFNNYIEVLDANNQPVKDGEEGKIVVTNLHNYSMPIIRYEIGDMAILGTEKCKCGNMLPTLNKVTGRITDHFILRNGTTVPAEYFIHLIGVVCNTGFIKKFQVIQVDYNLIELLVVPDGDIAESQKKDIEDKIKLVMGQDCVIIWDFVEEIPKSKSGKYLYTKCLIQR